jgi:hypothetical protein
MKDKAQQEIDDVIANGRRLVKEAREALAMVDRIFAEHNIDPKDSLEEVRRQGGEDAVQALQAQVQAALSRVEDDVERQRLHTQKVRPEGRRPSTRRDMI